MSTAQDLQPQIELEQGKVRVLGVLLDPLLSRVVDVQPEQGVDETVQDFVVNLLQAVNKDINLDGPAEPQIVQVFSGELFRLSVATFLDVPPEVGSIDRTTTTFGSIKAPPSPKEFLVMLGSQGWSYTRELCTQLALHNKENLKDVPVEAMAKLQIKDKPSTSKPLKRTKPSSADPIAALRVELGGRLDELESTNADFKNENKQLRLLNATLLQKAAKMDSLESSLAEVKKSNIQLKSIVAELKKSDDETKECNIRLESTIADLQKCNIRLESTFADLQKHNIRLESTVAYLKKSNEETKKHNIQLESTVADVKRSNIRLESTVADLELAKSRLTSSVETLQSANKELSETVSRYKGVIRSLHRRIVLDDVRQKLLDTYKISAVSKDVNIIVNELRPLLSKQDSDLLSLDALKMVFDPSKQSIRNQGNKAAHEASKQDLADSVLGTDLTRKQCELMRNIYIYGYGTEPDWPAPEF